jgi:hypothetical protein
MAGLSSIINLGYHGTNPAIADAITTSGFKGGTVPTWAGTGKTFTTPNINVASTYGPRQIPIVQSAQHFKLPGGGIPGQTLTEAFKNIGKTKFGFETALSPEKATKGMTALERMKGKYPHSQTLQRLLKTGTTAITNPTNWARLLGLPLSALTGILSSTPVGSAEMPAYGSEEYKTLMAREALFKRKQKQTETFKKIREKELADATAAAKAKADAAAAAAAKQKFSGQGAQGGGGGANIGGGQQTSSGIAGGAVSHGAAKAARGSMSGWGLADGGLINFYRYGGFSG